MNTGSCLAFCQTRTHETAMSTISVWDIDLGDAVMGVTRRRDGFRHSSDERSKGTAAVCCNWWQKVPQGGANKSPQPPARYDDFLCGQARIRGDSQLCEATVFTAAFFLSLAQA